MSTINKRKPIRKNDSISYNDLDQYGLGSWIKDNASWLAPIAAGAATIATGGMAAPLLAPAMMAGSAVGGAVTNNYKQEQAQDAQNAAITQQNAKTQAQGKLNNLQTENPSQSYMPVAKCGGRLRKKVDGGPLTIPKVEGTKRATADSVKTYQGRLTSVLADKTKGKVNIDSILTANTNKPDFNRLKIPEYAQQIIDTSGDYALTPDEQKAALGTDYDKYVKAVKNYRTNVSNYSEAVNTKGVLELNPDVTKENFGYRNMLERMPWSKEEGTPYTYLKDKLPEKAMGGTLNYGGQLHEGPDGGNPVDGKGNVNLANPTALVQKGEVGYNTEDGSTYIFSDDLFLDKGKTFAREAKQIQSKYKRRLGKNMIEKHDALASKGYNMDMKSLLDKQEQVREINGIADNIKEMRKGGKLPTYPKPNVSNGFNMTLPRNNYNVLPENKLMFGVNTNLNLPKSDTSLALQQANAGPQYTPPSFKEATGSTNISEAGWTPDTGMGWQSAASLVAPILGAITNRLTRKKPSKIQLDESGPAPKGINLERERAADREQANLTRANIKRALKSGTSAQGYMANVAAAETGVQRGLGQQLGESYQKEEAFNANLPQEGPSEQAKLQTQIYNPMLDTQTNAQNQGDITSIVNAANMYGKDVLQSKRDMNYLQMMDPRYQILARRRKWYSPKEQKLSINPEFTNGTI